MRDGDKRIVRLKEGSPQGRHVVIVDDLVQSGGTLMECQKLIKSQVRPCPGVNTDMLLNFMDVDAGCRHAAEINLLSHEAAQGAKHVSAFATHGVFPRESWQRFTSANGSEEGFKYFWITDSCPRTVSKVKGQAPFEIISLADPIAAALLI